MNYKIIILKLRGAVFLETETYIANSQGIIEDWPMAYKR